MVDKEPGESLGKEKKAELTLGEKLVAQGWARIFIGNRLELLSIEGKLATIGVYDAMGNKLVPTNAPIDEWIKVLTELAKKAGAKA